ncbi:demethoxyubiquinone hydroxylase family protein [Paremcibacter congregatus]|uniref:3-demethoxyubiquinol 3-hydroxylase n=1 Tax=Paremcibacter congregatus TaxID=2043170 RepID=A0A2G4YPU2_9PROT|nr:demethoxyubiquinone hydroxylase family protein [Paremcibacter congregatus]PHZ84315.1 demethoxyubiquinone hydroxylase family protein [Paremcibacter congregatus]QDE28534.1 demethoxyubiquinone hydroxylase family protein [Paremcibacter congregatus]
MTTPERKPPVPPPLTKEKMIDRLLRVDQAGEYGAVRIYQGQLAVLGDNHPLRPTIQHMKEQEDVHLARFNDLIRERGARPTLLTPLWHVAGFALGAGTALLGEKAAMVCTEAVETVIDQHYADQIENLDADEAPLATELEKFRQEELEHKDTAIELGAQEAPGYALLSGMIKLGCRTVIKVAERI